MGISDTTFYKDSEYNYLKAKGWLIAGTVDATKIKMSAAGIAEFERLIESLPVKDQVLVRMSVLANAEQTVAAVKGFIQ